MIVRGFIGPIRGEGDKPTHTYIISDEQGKELYQQYKNLIQYLLEEFREKIGNSLRDAKDINAFLNFMVLFIRGVFYRDTIPDAMPAIAGQAHRYFLEQYIKVRKNQEPDLSPNIYFEWLREQVSKGRISEEDWFRDKIMDIVKFPADDRPGANTSSLLVHSLTVSGMASCAYLDAHRDDMDAERKLAILRLTCLFHDLGKPYDWRKHEELAARDLIELFSNYVEGDAGYIVKEAAELIPRDTKAAGQSVQLKKYYLDSDSISSSIDRVSAYLLRMLSEEARSALLAKAEQYLKISGLDETTFAEKCYNDWIFWHSHVSVDEKKKITEDFCKNAVELSRNNPLLVVSDATSSEHQKNPSAVMVSRLDVRNIQESIKVNDLRAMAGASLTVDFAIFVATPLILIFKAKLPAEAILYFGGGNVTVLLPRTKALDLTQAITSDVAKNCDIRLSAAAYPVLGSFAEFNKGIEAQMMQRKISEDGYAEQLSDRMPYYLNLFEFCEVCGSRPAEQQLSGKLYCKRCAERHNTGDNFHFVYKLDRLRYALEDMPNYLENMMEYIAGSSKEEVLKKKFGEYKNVAVLRFDANVAGAFIGSSISITDAFERSVRIDQSLKNSYRKFLDMVKNIDKDTYDRLVLGTIYMGGDDAFLLAPSRIAPYLAAFLINEFCLEMGCKLTLSCGIAVAKPKHPLIPLYEAAGYLLDEVAKKNIRASAYSRHKSLTQDDVEARTFRGVSAFYTIDGGFMTPESIEDVLKRLYESKVSRQYRQPFTVSEQGGTEGRGSLLRLLQLVSHALNGEGINYTLDSLKTATEQDLKKLLQDEDASKKVKELISSLKSDVNVELLGDKSVNLQLIFARRQAERLPDKRALILELLQTTELRGNSVRLPLADVLVFAKVVLGE
ncbi:MAG: hypothetical protein QXI87_06090 [Thermoproteota archaeon]